MGLKNLEDEAVQLGPFRLNISPKVCCVGTEADSGLSVLSAALGQGVSLLGSHCPWCTEPRHVDILPARETGSPVKVQGASVKFNTRLQWFPATAYTVNIIRWHW